LFASAISVRWFPDVRGPPNEKKLSHRWRERALFYYQLSSLNPQLSWYKVGR
jgi:hypothetical protein